MTERDGLESTWGHSIRAPGGSGNLKGSGNSKSGGGGVGGRGGAIITNASYQEDSTVGGGGSEGDDIVLVNSKLSEISMVRRSSDESRAEIPVSSTSSGATAPTRQHNRVAPLNEPEVDAQGSRLSAISLPGNAPVLGQAATSVTGGGGGGIPDMRTHVKPSAVSGSATNPISRAVTPPQARASSPRQQPSLHPAPSGRAGDGSLGSSTVCSPLTALDQPLPASHPRAEQPAVGKSHNRDSSLSQTTSFSSSSAPKLLSTSTLSPQTLSGSQEIASPCPQLTFVQEQPVSTTTQNEQEKRQLKQRSPGQQYQTLTSDHSPDNQLYPLLHQPLQTKNNNNSQNNTSNKDNNDSESCKSGELDFVNSGSQSFHSLNFPDTVHYSKSKGLKSPQDEPFTSDHDIHAGEPLTQSAKLFTAKEKHFESDVTSEVKSPTGSCYSGLGSLGPGVLTPVHSLSCSPTQSRRLQKEPSFEDNTQIPLDFVYRDCSRGQDDSIVAANLGGDAAGFEHETAQTSSAVRTGSRSSLKVETKGANGNVFRFLLDGHSIDLSCEDEESLGGKGHRRNRSASSVEDGSKVRRSYSTPNSLLSRPAGERYPLSDKKSLSLFLGSESSYSALDESVALPPTDEAKVVFPSDKRFSAGQSSIVTVGTVATTDSDCKGDKRKDKKKKKRLWKRRSKHEAAGVDKDASSVLSVNLPGTESKRSSKGSGGSVGIAGFFRKREKKGSEHPGGQGEEDADPDVGSRPASAASSAKGPRRLARRGMGMFPSSNWRRLRNTLKAANEMQAQKKPKHTLTREDSFLRKFSTRNHHQNVQNSANSTDDDSRWGGSGGGAGGGGGGSGGGATYTSEGGVRRVPGRRFVIQHDGNFMFYWLGVVTVSVLYNLWTCIARQAFREIQQKCNECWFALDALFDTIYILDIIIQFRTGYLDQGLMVYDSRKLRDRYTHSRIVFIDFLCLLPLDFLQILIGIHPMIRFPRFLKVYRSFRFIHMLESRTAYPNLIRVANLTHILFLGAHWFAAFYYMISEAEDFKGEWAYPKPVGEFADVTRKYLRSLFWSTLTLTTIGDLPPPDNSEQ